MKITIYFGLILAIVRQTFSCPTECFCMDRKMTCQNVILKEDDLANLQIPKDITELVLSSNELKTISENTMTNLRHLESLEISDNAFTKIPIFTFRGFSNLRRLVLSNNQITELTEGSFIGLDKCGHLDLKQNRIKQLQPGVFDKLTLSIYEIHLEDNELKSLQNGVFPQLKFLKDLFLTRNEIKNIDSQVFAQMRMEHLGLGSNQIQVIPSSAFEGFRIKTRINLLNNPLDCSCKHAMGYKINFQHLRHKLWGHCKTPYHFEPYSTEIMNAHEELDHCSMCDLNPCRNQGKCTGNKTSFKCACQERYKGQTCEVNICQGYTQKPEVSVIPDRIPLKQINHTEIVIVQERINDEDDAKKLKILYAMCSFEFIVIICFVVYFMWKRYEEWKLRKKYEHEKSRAILFSIRNQTNAQLAKALVEENEEFPADLKQMILKGSVPV
ncbi:chondroadherin-like [Clytia hemisphaerica]|uniref:EGF-like domain-containing protein n=1 Tax=Clytia hemisphaerica TaxID=252671 RepID=A0A7M5WLF5_9CNID